MNLYFDAHSHLLSHSVENLTRVYSLRVDSTEVEIPQSGYFSAGIHPYDIEHCSIELVERLEDIVRHPRCIAIGECGVDKRVENISKQLALFEAHCSIANALQKPLVIHCVKAQGELLKILKTVNTPKIFHSYTKVNDAILYDPTIYFSLSKRNIAHSEPIPLEKIVFESDEDNTTSIEELYNETAKLRGITPERLCEIVEQTFRQIFKI